MRVDDNLTGGASPLRVGDIDTQGGLGPGLPINASALFCLEVDNLLSDG